MRNARPWFRKQNATWYVCINGKQVNLGKTEKAALAKFKKLILRMADLLALQPNMDIRLHIVAPEARKQKVFTEILRPVFSLLERAPLSESCSFISYDAVEELMQNKHLGHLSDTVLEEYEEFAE